ncbi:MAG: polyhydroxyalkanoate synthesis regulator DNA-binding domain-containing protein [Gammaproteobacteria bacterium]|nr:polyhydroxyalkanoate synthesis regulator DNA-binding domain-containing protein [Gammaproteobacteria bacterium]
MQTRIIKKYPNRRLYDTEESRYITLGEIRQLVRDHVDFQVIERKSQTDITTQVLLQVIAELENQGDRMLSPEFLSGLIRAHGQRDAAELNAQLLEALKPRVVVSPPHEEPGHTTF